MTASNFDTHRIRGLDIRAVTPCRCGCPLIRVHPYSVKSNIPIWKCSWCTRRKGKLTETEIKLLQRWVHQFGWTFESLVFHENGQVYASCQLPALRKAGSGLRREDGLVPECRQSTQVSTATPFLEKANALWPDMEVTLRSKRVLTLIEQRDEWLKDRGWYDIITVALEENWNGEDDGFICDPE